MNHQANSRQCRMILQAEKSKQTEQRRRPVITIKTTSTNKQDKTAPPKQKDQNQKQMKKPTTATNRVTKTDISTKECYTCRNMGHISRNCPQKQQQPNRNNQRSGNNRRVHNEQHNVEKNKMISELLARLMEEMPKDSGYYRIDQVSNRLGSDWETVRRKNKNKSTNQNGR